MAAAADRRGREVTRRRAASEGEVSEESDPAVPDFPATVGTVLVERVSEKVTPFRRVGSALLVQ